MSTERYYLTEVRVRIKGTSVADAEQRLIDALHKIDPDTDNWDLSVGTARMDTNQDPSYGFIP